MAGTLGRRGHQHRRCALRDIGEFTDAGHRNGAGGNCAQAVLAGSPDLAGERAAFERCGHATEAAGAFRLDMLDDGPGLLFDRFGDLLDCAGAGSGVDHAVEVGFAQQDEARIARKTTCILIGQAEGRAMRQKREGIRPAQSRREPAMLTRSMFTFGSRRVIIRKALSAWISAGAGFLMPQCSRTPAQRRRKARIFASVRNWS